MRVVFSLEAEAQLASLYRYIAREASPVIAERYTGAIVDVCEGLATFPRRGTPRDDLRPGLRTLAFHRRVTIAYAVDDDVIVAGIFYGGQDFAGLLGDD